MTKTVEYTYHSPVNSDVLQDVYYNVNYKTLYVKFTNGRFAGYADVPAGVVDSLVNASSVGRYYNSNIRGRYKGLDAGNLSLTQATAPLTGYLAPAVQSTQPYVVRGACPVESNVSATSVEDAVAQFLKNHPGGTVSEVVVKF